MPQTPIKDPLSTRAPEPLAHRRVSLRRDLLMQQPPSDLWVPVDPDPPARQPYFTNRLPWDSRNEIKYLINGPDTFAEMAKTIQTARTSDHFVYIIAWWLSDDLPVFAGADAHALFTAASNRGAQVRALLWRLRPSDYMSSWLGALAPVADYVNDTMTEQEQINGLSADHINALPNGAAIRDSRHLKFGTHHQKILIVNGTEGLVAFCGGIDVNPDRVSSTAAPGTPFHDVHCRIKGPAAYELLRIFVERWSDHPDSRALDAAKGALRGGYLNKPIPTGASLAHVPHRSRELLAQIGRTYGNGSTHQGLGRPYGFAPGGEETCRQIFVNAIRSARRFIYIEDQYLASQEASLELLAALRRIEHLTILIPEASITSPFPPDWAEYRRDFLAPLIRADRSKVRVFQSMARGQPRYVHSKTWVIDDRLAIIGSANCNLRGWTHDSEVIAAICDDVNQYAGMYHFAHRLRIALWARHLNMDTPEGHAELADGVASAVHWNQIDPPPGANIQAYDENSFYGLTLGQLAAVVGGPGAGPVAEYIVDPDGS